MPPKARVSKEDIISASIDFVRENGADALTARSIAKRLGCSTQPIFSNFNSMEELVYEVLAYAAEVYKSYQESVIKSGEYPIYKAIGMAYIKFAREESRLFMLLFMRDRRSDKTADPVDSDFENAVSTVMKTTGLSHDEASLFHLEMWAFTHGIATILATSFMNFDYEMIDRMLTDQYVGLKASFGKEQHGGYN